MVSLWGQLSFSQARKGSGVTLQNCASAAPDLDAAPSTIVGTVLTGCLLNQQAIFGAACVS
jgi:hypothetical protein